MRMTPETFEKRVYNILDAHIGVLKSILGDFKVQ